MTERFQQVLRAEDTQQMRAMLCFRPEELLIVVLHIVWCLRVQDDIVVGLQVQRLHSLGEALQCRQRKVLVRIQASHVVEHLVISIDHLILMLMLVLLTICVVVASFILRHLFLDAELAVHRHVLMVEGSVSLN